MHKNSDLMPNFPPEGRGPTGVPIGSPIPSTSFRKKKQDSQMNFMPYGVPPNVL